jgi:hypothetical protein
MSSVTFMALMKTLLCLQILVQTIAQPLHIQNQMRGHNQPRGRNRVGGMEPYKEFARTKNPGTGNADSHSEFGQDVWINENVFKNRTNGVYVEFGARDGVYNSNTYLYQKRLGWKGILIEAGDDDFRKLQHKRCEGLPPPEFVQTPVAKANEDNYCFKHAVSNESGINFYHNECLGGKCRVTKPILKDTVLKENQKVLTTITIGDAIDKTPFKKIDFMSVDCEGCEVLALKDFDFEKYKPCMVLVENQENQQTIRNILTHNKYEVIFATNLDFYAKRQEFC